MADTLSLTPSPFGRLVFGTALGLGHPLQLRRVDIEDLVEGFIAFRF